MKGVDSTIIKKALVETAFLLDEDMFNNAFNKDGNMTLQLKDL